MLRQRVAQLPSVQTVYGWETGNVVQDDDGVSVTIKQRGDSSAERVLRGAYVVGSDGARSVVREQAGITHTRTDHDRMMVLLAVSYTHLTLPTKRIV